MYKKIYFGFIDSFYNSFKGYQCCDLTFSFKGYQFCFQNKKNQKPFKYWQRKKFLQTQHFKLITLKMSENHSERLLSLNIAFVLRVTRLNSFSYSIKRSVEMHRLLFTSRSYQGLFVDLLILEVRNLSRTTRMKIK